MAAIFAVVRPEGRTLRERTYAFLGSSGYSLGPGLVLPAGTPDEQAAAWVNALSVGLLVLPFHLHRDHAGQAADGVGIALLLSERYEEKLPILMPVSAYSLRAGFEARFEELQERRPLIAQNVLSVSEHELTSVRVVSQLRRMTGSSVSSPPIVYSVPPTTIRHGPGYTGLPREEQPSPGTFSTVPPVRSHRAPDSTTGGKGEDRTTPLNSGYFVVPGRKPRKASES
jgi:hypothetical protein